MTVQNAGNGHPLQHPIYSAAKVDDQMALRWEGVVHAAHAAQRANEATIPNAQERFTRWTTYFHMMEGWRNYYMDEPKGGEFWDKKR